MIGGASRSARAAGDGHQRRHQAERRGRAARPAASDGLLARPSPPSARRSSTSVASPSIRAERAISRSSSCSIDLSIRRGRNADRPGRGSARGRSRSWSRPCRTPPPPEQGFEQTRLAARPLGSLIRCIVSVFGVVEGADLCGVDLERASPCSRGRLRDEAERLDAPAPRPRCSSGDMSSSSSSMR